MPSRATSTPDTWWTTPSCPYVACCPLTCTHISQHGIAVALSGPAVYQFTALTSPDRHREAAKIFNEFQPDAIDDSRIKDEDIGKLLSDRIARFLVGLDVPRGLEAIGYTVRPPCRARCRADGSAQYADIPELVTGTLPQRRVLDLARASSLSPEQPLTPRQPDFREPTARRSSPALSRMPVRSTSSLSSVLMSRSALLNGATDRWQTCSKGM